MELASTVFHIIESVTPVDSEETDHRKEDAHTDAGAAFDFERIELSYVRPAVTALEEEECEDGRVRMINKSTLDVIDIASNVPNLKRFYKFGRFSIICASSGAYIEKD